MKGRKLLKISQSDIIKKHLCVNALIIDKLLFHMELGMDIREIETIIDTAHENHSVFKAGKEQTMFDLLSTFEDTCFGLLCASVLNPSALQDITDQIDALNFALFWANQLCYEDSEPMTRDINEVRSENCYDLLNNYAYPYSLICSGYISYSRKRYDVEISQNVVTFKFHDPNNTSALNDIMRERFETKPDEQFALFQPMVQHADTIRNFIDRVEIVDEKIEFQAYGYELDLFKTIAQQQWDASKTLPDNWKFDKFSMAEYKEFWVLLSAICYMHLFAGFKIQDPHIRLKNSIIVQTLDEMVETIVSLSSLLKEKVETIINYITYTPTKKNVDIMYQPLIRNSNNELLIAPMLITGSRPERNILSVISTRHDSAYSKEVNDLEALMISELESYIKSDHIIKHKHLRDDLPDIDFAVYDEATQSVLICETKWFAAADSTKEVLAKEDEITHGCQQVESIMFYAMSDKQSFMKQVFNVDDVDMVDLFGCVVAKNNIRTQNKYVPVIDLKRIEELFDKYSLNTTFHMIRNHEYETPFPEDVQISFKSVKYAGFIFRIPAIVIGTLDGISF